MEMLKLPARKKTRPAWKESPKGKVRQKRKEKGRSRRQVHDESLSPVYPSPDRNLAANGSNPARRSCCIQAIACLGAARSGLSDDAGGHVLSGRQPVGYGIVRYCPARTPTRRGSWPEPDSLDQF